jgi:hypothetical protein
MPLRGHASYLKTKDFPGFRIHAESDAQGFTFGVLGSLQIIELDLRKRIFRIERLQKLLMLLLFLLGEKSDFSHDRFSSHPKNECKPPLRHPGGVEPMERKIESPLFLVTIRPSGGV